MVKFKDKIIKATDVAKFYETELKAAHPELDIRINYDYDDSQFDLVIHRLGFDFIAIQFNGDSYDTPIDIGILMASGSDYYHNNGKSGQTVAWLDEFSIFAVEIAELILFVNRTNNRWLATL